MVLKVGKSSCWQFSLEGTLLHTFKFCIVQVTTTAYKMQQLFTNTLVLCILLVLKWIVFFFSRFIVCEIIYMHRNAHKYKYTYIHIYISHLTLLCTKTFVVAVKIVGFRNVAIYSGRLMQKKLTWGWTWIYCSGD